MSVKIIHAADIHARPDRNDEWFASLETLAVTGDREMVDLFVLAGDLFDRGLQNSDKGKVPELMRVIADMLDIAPIVAVYGTPSHDVPGCYEALRRIGARYSFHVINPRHPLILRKSGQVERFNDLFPPRENDDRLLILGCPEPQKAWFLADKNGFGRDEATKAVTDGVRQILLGLGALRAECPTIPCLFVYHGEVRGSTLCNGQTLPPGGVAIGAEDLALVGADYYALGHIHQAQRIGDLSAYYAGSAYPVDWGEVDQKRFNIVTLGDDSPIPTDHHFVSVKCGTSTDYPHPPRKKITVDLGRDDFFVYTGETRGRQIRLIVRGTKEQLQAFDHKSALDEMKNAGVASGSEVITETIPVETVRAGEIREAQALADKVRVWAENSDKEPPDSVYEKAGVLEAEYGGEAVQKGGRWRIRRLVLRGAIGIWKGTGKDEIDIDLDRYDPGLIALLGPNGVGKTTVIENLHPYPCLMTRAGKLQDHFRLRDSRRDLYFTDEATGDEYRARIDIDGQNVSGGCDYYLYRNGEPLTTGRKDEYDGEIAELFGDMDLYRRSAFITQKPTKNHPDLADATKGEKKVLFRELVGIDYLNDYAASAKGKAEEHEAAIVRIGAQIDALQSTIDGKEQTAKDALTTEGRIHDVRHDLHTLENNAEKLTAEIAELDKRVRANRETRQTITDIKQRIEQARVSRDELGYKARAYIGAQAKEPEATAAVKTWEDLSREESTLSEERANAHKAAAHAMAEYATAKETTDAQRDEIGKDRRKVEAKLHELKNRKAILTAFIDGIEERLANKVECPACGHKFHVNELAERKNLEVAQQEILGELDPDIIACDKAIAELADQEVGIIQPPMPEPMQFEDTRLQAVKKQRGQIDIDAARQTLQAAQEATVRIEEITANMQRLGDEIERGQEQVRKLEVVLDPNVDEQHEQALQRQTQLQENISNTREKLAGLERDLEWQQKRLAEIALAESELSDHEEQLCTEQAESADWRTLQTACGPDGIQALELDALAPSIAAVANRLLSAAYGTRFQIEFQTTRMGGSGSARHQIEDFAIIIHDSEKGTEQALDTLSGGESVWVRKAIYDAFAVIRAQNRGLAFLTACMDETDSALDAEARDAYFRMIEASHQESGRYHTIVITHSPEAQQYIAQHIEVAELGAVERAEAVA